MQARIRERTTKLLEENLSSLGSFPVQCASRDAVCPGILYSIVSNR